MMGLITFHTRNHLLTSPSRYQESSFYFKSLSYNKYENLYITCSAEFPIYRTTHETAMTHVINKQKKKNEKKKWEEEGWGGGGEEYEEKGRKW